MSVIPSMHVLLEARDMSAKWDKMSPEARYKLLKKSSAEPERNIKAMAKHHRDLEAMSTKAWGDLGDEHKQTLSPTKEGGKKRKGFKMVFGKWLKVR